MLVLWFDITHTHSKKDTTCTGTRGWSRADLRSIYRFTRHLVWGSKFKKGRKRKTNVLHKNKKLPSASLVSKLKIELEHINTVKRKQNDNSTLIFLCFCQFLDKKVKTSCPELPRKQLDQLEQHCGCISTFYVVVELCYHCFLWYFAEQSQISQMKALKILPLDTNHGGASCCPFTLHNSTNAQIRALGTWGPTDWHTYINMY